MNNSFICTHCGEQILTESNVGTKNRNHCPFCLWSLHVDDQVAGDRKSVCKGEMEPIGLTFKKEGIDKYGKIRQGELMLIHRCNKCGKININRIAGDDKQTQILEVFNQSKNNNILRNELKKEEVDLLNLNNEPELKRQLFGR